MLENLSWDFKKSKSPSSSTGGGTTTARVYNRVKEDVKYAVVISAIYRGDPKENGQKITIYGKAKTKTQLQNGDAGEDMKHVIFISKTKPKMGLQKLFTFVALFNPDLEPGDLNSNQVLDAFKGWTMVASMKRESFNGKEYETWTWHKVFEAGPNIPKPVANPQPKQEKTKPVDEEVDLFADGDSWMDEI